MNEGLMSVLIIFGFMVLAYFISFVDKKKPAIKNVQPRVEAYKKEKGRIKKISA